MNAVKTFGTGTSFAVSVVEAFPGSYVVLDGHHRLAALYCLHNSKPFDFPAKVFHASMSSEQAQILSGGKNALHETATAHGVADTVN